MDEDKKFVKGERYFHVINPERANEMIVTPVTCVTANIYAGLVINKEVMTAGELAVLKYQYLFVSDRGQTFRTDETGLTMSGNSRIVMEDPTPPPPPEPEKLYVVVFKDERFRKNQGVVCGTKELADKVLGAYTEERYALIFTNARIKEIEL